jgi:PTH1 family peptidyl-tRNA hydrolase
MCLFVGLGNPGKEYQNTRHNVGFMVADTLRETFGMPAFSRKFKGVTSKGKAARAELMLLKPHTFMNLSGESVRAALDFYKLTPADVLVVHDELDIPLAQLKYKVGGGDAGHNGLKSITSHLGTANYARLRFGIGRPVHKSQVSDYVLEKFTASEALVVDERVNWIAEHLPDLLKDPHGTLAKLKGAA